jgi:hypothetical protein
MLLRLQQSNVKGSGKNMKLFLCLIKYYAIKTYAGLEVSLHVFLNIGIKQRQMISFTIWLLYSGGEYPRHKLNQMLVGPRVDLNAVAKRNLPSLAGMELQLSSTKAI